MTIQKITSLFLWAAIFFLSSFLAPYQVDAATCKVTDLSFTELFKKWKTELTIETENCSDGVILKLKRLAKKPNFTEAAYEVPVEIEGLQGNGIFYPDSSGTIKVKFEADEAMCSSHLGYYGKYKYDCVAFAEVLDAKTNNLIFSVNNSDKSKEVIADTYLYGHSKMKEFAKKGILMRNCVLGCGSDKWQFIEFLKGTGFNTQSSSGSSSSNNSQNQGTNNNPYAAEEQKDIRQIVTITSGDDIHAKAQYIVNIKNNNGAVAGMIYLPSTQPVPKCNAQTHPNFLNPPSGEMVVDSNDKNFNLQDLPVALDYSYLFVLCLKTADGKYISDIFDTEKGALSQTSTVDENACVVDHFGDPTKFPALLQSINKTPDDFLKNDPTLSLQFKGVNEKCFQHKAEIDIIQNGKTVLKYDDIYISQRVLKITMQPGDSQCKKSQDPHCKTYARVKVFDKSGKKIYEGQSNEQTWNCKKTDSCSTKGWKKMKESGFMGKTETPEGVGYKQPSVDQGSPCADGTSYKKDCYEFLAPIPGIGKDANNKDDPNFKKTGDRIAILNVTQYQLGNYINKIFQIALAILAVIAVVMIIVAGVEYMTVESIYGKTGAKTRIQNAALGLILAFGSYIILYTINPNLLNIDFGSRLNNIKLDIKKEEPPKRNSDGSYTNQHTGEEYEVDGVLVKDGEDWIPSHAKGKWKTLRSKDHINKSIIDNVFINKQECTKIGKLVTGGSGCTSVYFDKKTFNTVKNGLTQLQKDCDCKFTISGGSEFWHHSTHHYDSTAIDISNAIQHGVTEEDMKKLAQTLTKGMGDYSSLGEAIKSGKFGYNTPTKLNYVNAFAEPGKLPHWHLDFK